MSGVEGEQKEVEIAPATYKGTNSGLEGVIAEGNHYI